MKDWKVKGMRSLKAYFYCSGFTRKKIKFSYDEEEDAVIELAAMPASPPFKHAGTSTDPPITDPSVLADSTPAFAIEAKLSSLEALMHHKFKWFNWDLKA